MIRRRWLVVVGLLFFIGGMAAALYLAWMVWPLRASGSSPGDLQAAAREGYLILVAEAFDHDGNLDLAKERLLQLKQPDEDVTTELVELTWEYLQEGQDLRTLQKLVRLTHTLGASTSEMLVHLPVDRPTPTRTPTRVILSGPEGTATALAAIPTPKPTSTATPAPRYRLVKRQRECEDGEGPGQIRIRVQDQKDRGVAGVRVGLSWPDGGETLFTGFHPGQDDGYTDAVMDDPGEYRVTIMQDNGGDIVDGLLADAQQAGCPAQSQRVDWQVVFERYDAAPSGS